METLITLNIKKMKKQNQKLSDVRKSLSGKLLTPQQAVVVCGGTFPWIDQPGP
jgi:hypothetical protein